MPVIRTLSRSISAGRLAALDVLEAVAAGAYASDVLRDRSQKLCERDAGLAGQIVFGCLRYQGQLDYLIEHYSGHKAQTLDGAVQLALRTAIFQLRYLERVPAHAAVHESVEFVKARKRAAAGFTNAVLRKVNRAPLAWPDLATELSCPAWLLERWTAHFGADAAHGIATAALTEPGRYIRVPPGSVPALEVEVQPTSIPGAFRLLSTLPAGTRSHDISSQAILPLLDLQSGDSYLDVCAAPGNKTLQALETPLAFAVACDINPRRIRDIPAVCPRVVLDATDPLPFGATFTKIFIDAPCSGTGTLARNPEIKWRVREHDFLQFRRKQLAMVRQAVRLLARSGKLLYATCSLEREENEDVIEDLLEENPEFCRGREVWRLPGRDEGDGFYGCVLESDCVRPRP